MLLLVAGGLLLAVLARTPWRWLVVLWAIHLPTFMALILISGWGDITTGNWAGLAGALGAEGRLILAWTGTIFVSVSLFSTIDPDDLARGMRARRPVRRGPLLMSTMRMRGYATEAQLGRPGIADVVVLAVALMVVVGAGLARWGPLPGTFVSGRCSGSRRRT